MNPLLQERGRTREPARDDGLVDNDMECLYVESHMEADVVYETLKERESIHTGDAGDSGKVFYAVCVAETKLGKLGILSSSS